jgi:hypothetical protein
MWPRWCTAAEARACAWTECGGQPELVQYACCWTEQLLHVGVRHCPKGRTCTGFRRSAASDKIELAGVRLGGGGAEKWVLHHLPLFGPSFLTSKCTAGFRGLQSPGGCQSCSTVRNLKTSLQCQTPFSNSPRGGPPPPRPRPRKPDMLMFVPRV